MDTDCSLLLIRFVFSFMGILSLPMLFIFQVIYDVSLYWSMSFNIPPCSVKR